MQHRILTAIVLTCCLGSAVPAQATGGPRIQFETTAWDFGSIKQGESATTIFTYRNTGQAQLVITEARSSCGCTVPSYTREPVAVGQTGEIKVTFNSRGRRGKQHKQVTVRSNDPTNPVVYLSVQGDIEIPPSGEIQYNPSRIDFGMLEEGAKLEETITIRNSGERDLIISAVQGAPQELNAFLQGQTTLAPGQSAEILVTLEYGPRTRPGYYERTVNIRSNDPVRPSARVPCVAYVRGPRGGRLVTLQGEIDIGTIRETDQALVSIPLLNTGDQPVTVNRAQVAGTALKVVGAEQLIVEPGQTRYVEVRSSDRLRKGTFRDRILLYTSVSANPRAPSHTVNFSGYVTVDNWPMPVHGPKPGPVQRR
jgi:hypothetical protein